MQLTDKEREDYKRFLEECGYGCTVEYIKQVCKSTGSAEARRLGKQFCANRLWTEIFKPLVISWAGWDSRWMKEFPEHQFIRSADAYEAVYAVWYSQLPDCGSQCGCA